MIEIFIAFILIIFIGLFVVLSIPMKDEVEKFNKEAKKDSPTQQS